MSNFCWLLWTKHINYKTCRVIALSIIASIMYLPSFSHFELRSIAIFWETLKGLKFSDRPRFFFKLRFRGGVLTESLRGSAPFGTFRCLFWFSRFFPSARVVNIKYIYTPSLLKRSAFSSGDTEETILQNRVHHQAKIKKSLRSSGSIVQKSVK